MFASARQMTSGITVFEGSVALSPAGFACRFRQGLGRANTGIRHPHLAHWVGTRRKVHWLPVEGLRVKATPVAEEAPHVAEYHGLDVDGGAPIIRDVVQTTVGDSAGILPGPKHGGDGTPQLFVCILRKRELSQLSFDGFFVRLR